MALRVRKDCTKCRLWKKKPCSGTRQPNGPTGARGISSREKHDLEPVESSKRRIAAQSSGARSCHLQQRITTLKTDPGMLLGPGRSQVFVISNEHRAITSHYYLDTVIQPSNKFGSGRNTL